jgi:rSAM/selenodomain-associated transferase 1
LAARPVRVQVAPELLRSSQFIYMKEEALIIMAKNAIKGKVKTRLAEDLGEEETLHFYENLLSITQLITNDLKADKFIFYSDFIPDKDVYDSKNYQKQVQIDSNDLGDRMKAAFEYVFQLGYKSTIIIGTDCPYLTTSILDSGFTLLNQNDVVIGPALDGGFYLLGCKKMPSLNFNDIVWSTENVLNQLLSNLEKLDLKAHLLDALEDIDNVENWLRYNRTLKAQ